MQAGSDPHDVSIISKQLAILQEYIALKFGSEFENFYRARVIENIGNQGPFGVGGIIKQETTDYDPLSDNVVEVSTNSIGTNNQQIYYENPPAFTIAEPNIQPGIILGSIVYPESATSSTSNSRSKITNAAKTIGKQNSNARKKDGKKHYFYCSVKGCQKRFRQLIRLNQHIYSAHEHGLCCSTIGCGISFPDKAQLQQHEARCPLKAHKCQWEGCEKTFRTSKLLHGHISAVHRRTRKAGFKCTIPGCLKAYPDEFKLKLHVDRCRFKFEYDANIANHDLSMESDSANSRTRTTLGTSITENFSDESHREKFDSDVNGGHHVVVNVGNFLVKTEDLQEEVCVMKT